MAATRRTPHPSPLPGRPGRGDRRELSAPEDRGEGTGGSSQLRETGARGREGALSPGFLSVALPLSPEEDDAGVADLHAGGCGLVHRAVGGLLARAAQPGRRRGRLARRRGRGAIAVRLRFPEMSEGHLRSVLARERATTNIAARPVVVSLDLACRRSSSRRRSGARRAAEFGKTPSCWR